MIAEACWSCADASAGEISFAILIGNESSSIPKACFLSERKAPLSVDGAQKLIERLGVAAKMPFPIHAHMLRHAAGYALAGRGVDTRTLQAFMGHRSIANTVIYTSVTDKRIRNIWGK
jgi:site-specific recombinase XerD